MDKRTVGSLLCHTPSYAVNEMDTATLSRIVANGASFPVKLGMVHLDYLVTDSWGVYILEATESPVCCVMHKLVYFPKEKVKEAVMAFIDRCNLSADVMASTVSFPHLTDSQPAPEPTHTGWTETDYEQVLANLHPDLINYTHVMDLAYTAYLDLLTQLNEYTGKAPLPIGRSSATTLEEVRDYLLQLLGLMHDHSALLISNKINRQDTPQKQIMELLKQIQAMAK